MSVAPYVNWIWNTLNCPTKPVLAVRNQLYHHRWISSLSIFIVIFSSSIEICTHTCETKKIIEHSNHLCNTWLGFILLFSTPHIKYRTNRIISLVSLRLMYVECLTSISIKASIVVFNLHLKNVRFFLIIIWVFSIKSFIWQSLKFLWISLMLFLKFSEYWKKQVG